MSGAPIVARSSSAEETRGIGAALAPVLRPGDMLLLVGDLGTGKTTFTQGLAAGLGVTAPVTSPTFTLVRAYACPEPGPGPGGGEAIRTLLHADLYRLERLRDVVDLGLGELVEDDAVAVIEWGDMAGSLFGPEVLTVRLAAGSGSCGAPSADDEGADDEGADDERIVTLEADGSWVERADALAHALGPWKR